MNLPAIVARARLVTPPGIRRAVKRRLPFGLRTYLVQGDCQWIRGVMNPDTRRTFEQLGPESLAPLRSVGLMALSAMAKLPQVRLPRFRPRCSAKPLPGPFDVVIREQVLEHDVNPLIAIATLRRMCNPDGHVFVSTPFLIRLHDDPGDYWRFTPQDWNAYCSAKASSRLGESWGNREVIVANFGRWVPRRWPWQPLRNEPHLPVVVWSLACPADRAPRSRSRDASESRGICARLPRMSALGGRVPTASSPWTDRLRGGSPTYLRAGH